MVNLAHTLPASLVVVIYFLLLVSSFYQEVEAECLVDDIVYQEGESIGFIGTECLDDTRFLAIQSECGPDGEIIDYEDIEMECSEYCVQCGSPGIGAALCVGDPDHDCDDGDGFCFSPNMMTIVEGKGHIAIKNLRPGVDRVLTKSGAYQTIYSMNHYHHTKPTNFLQIHYTTTTSKNTNATTTDEKVIEEQKQHQKQPPIELTSMHMIYIEGKQYPIPALDIKVGDYLQSINNNQNMNGASIRKNRVTDIQIVTRNGYYNPLSMDGTILIGGGAAADSSRSDGMIIASTYTYPFPMKKKTKYESDGAYIEIAGIPILPIQTMYDIITAPYVAFCTSRNSAMLSSFCNNEYDANNIDRDSTDSILNPMFRKVARYFDRQDNSIVQFLLFGTFITLFVALNLLFSSSSNACFWHVLVVGVLLIRLTRKKILPTKTKSKQFQ